MITAETSPAIRRVYISDRGYKITLERPINSHYIKIKNQNGAGVHGDELKKAIEEVMQDA